MGLISCPDCQKKISDRVDKCPNCGCPKQFFEIERKEDTVSEKDIQTNEKKKLSRAMQKEMKILLSLDYSRHSRETG